MSGAHTLFDAEYVTTAEHLQAAKMYSLAACVMLFYDICLTFGDEVEKIWKRPFRGPTILWFANRYLNPLGYIVVICSFQQDWPTSVCNRYILYPEILKTITDTAIGVIFILRLYAIYSRNRTVLAIFVTLLLAEIGIKIWSFTDGDAVQLPPGLVGCILTGRSERRFIWTFVVELIFDSCVFLATVVKTLQIYRTLSSHRTTYHMLMRIMLRDGVVYFAVIFGANLITVLFLLTATPDIKPINASFSNLLTSLMVSRLMLNLRIAADERFGRQTRLDASLPKLLAPSLTKKNFEDTIIGNLGEGVLSWTDEDVNTDGQDGAEEDAIELTECFAIQTT